MKDRKEKFTEEQAVRELADDDLAQAVGGSSGVPPYRNETNIEASVTEPTAFQWEIKDDILKGKQPGSMNCKIPRTQADVK